MSCLNAHSASIDFKQTINARNLIIDAEGLIRGNYTDSQGIPHCWYGFNANYHPCHTIHSQKQALHYLDSLIDSYKLMAQGYYNSSNKAVMAVLTDFFYNIGYKGNSFVKMRERLNMGDFKGAAHEMKQSKWCKQVATRCTRNVNIMLKYGGK